MKVLLLKPWLRYVAEHLTVVIHRTNSSCEFPGRSIDDRSSNCRAEKSRSSAEKSRMKVLLLKLCAILRNASQS